MYSRFIDVNFLISLYLRKINYNKDRLINFLSTIQRFYLKFNLFDKNLIYNIKEYPLPQFLCLKGLTMIYLQFLHKYFLSKIASHAIDY
jgi:hypothetical protein